MWLSLCYKVIDVTKDWRLQDTKYHQLLNVTKYIILKSTKCYILINGKNNKWYKILSVQITKYFKKLYVNK